jgi:hypothetical protein
LPGDRPRSTEGGLSITHEPQILPAAAEVVSLNKEAERVELSVDDRIKLDDQRLRKWMVIGFIGTFVVCDVLTLVGSPGWVGWIR